MDRCAGRPAKGRRWKSVTVKEQRTVPAASDARVVREGRREAFTGEGAGEVLSGVRQVRGADVFVPQKAIRPVSISRDTCRPRVVVDPGMRRSLLHGNREISIAVPASRGRDVVGKAGGRSRR